MAVQDLAGRRGPQRREERRQLGPLHEMVREAAQQRVPGPHDRTGQGEMGAQLTGGQRQQIGAADVRHEADPGLRHRHLRALGDDPDAAVRRHAHAAAHHDAVHDRHVRLGIAGDPGVEPVLVAPERGRRLPARTGVLVDGPDVAARAQAALPGPGEHDGRHLRIALPAVESRRDRRHHRVGEGVERLRPVQGQHPGTALDAHPYELLAHRRAPVRLRATMTRMISLVPSRIWWTRRSRTIFSTPYSAR